MMYQLIENFVGHPFKNEKLPSHDLYVARAEGKLVNKPSLTKVNTKSPIYIYIFYESKGIFAD